MNTPESSHNRPLARFVALVTAAGLFALGQALTQVAGVPHPMEWGALAALAVACAPFSLRVPGAPVHASLSDTFLFTIVAMYGPAPAIIAIALDGFLVSWRRGHPVERILFNAANPSFAMWVGAQAFMSLQTRVGGSTVLGFDIATPALFLMAGVHFLVSSSLIAVATGLDKGRSPFHLWRQHFTVLSLSHAASASAAVFVLVLARNAGVFAVVAVSLVDGMIYLGLQARFGRLADAEQHVDILDRLYLSTIRAFSTAIDAKDGVTSSHIHRVQSYCAGLARALGITNPLELKAIEAAALLHDTGKLAVPEHILNKPGRLTPAEFEQMKQHVDVGADILSSIEFPYPVVPIVAAHHESWDGSGYPRGLCGEEIPIGARILSVVDCFDALTSDRPYRLAMTTDEALAIVLERRGRMYDPRVVDAFVAALPTLRAEPVTEPQLQRAVTRIQKAARQDAAAPPPPVATVALPASTIALPSSPAPAGPTTVADRLSRVMAGAPGVEDLAQLAAFELHAVAPGAAFVFFVASPDGRLEVRAVVGTAAESVSGLVMNVGERVTGWAAATRQQVVNADARLDLGSLPASDAPQFCLATPVVHGEQLVGAVTAYSPASFSDQVAQRIGQVVAGLAPMLAVAAAVPFEAAHAVRGSRTNLRVASRR